jgi:23S rRNA 5-hydroxycytidine C2501 synthase
MERYPIELLAPARDLRCGFAAINHGADAVYIGAPQFSARAAAGNSLADIEKLIHYAHQFFARVYIALNTILTDKELEEALRLVHDLWNIGADALIVQDMGLLECDLPPIPLHASTQTDNRSVAKVVFLEKVGFQQVVLARELHLDEIRAIRAATTVPLEFFIHGALCVSYSGRCFISEVMAGRSANRGECAQFCRHCYSLRDGDGRIIEKDRYLLSLKDFDLSDHIGELLDVGITSFKIEGRLKDENYVKNVTAFYRLILDGLLAADNSLRPSSSGRCRFGFTPDTEKSFHRGKTNYYLQKKRNRPGSLDTPKSLGEKVGTVAKTGRKTLTITGGVPLVNGDGLCYFDRSNHLVGLKVNRVEGGIVYPREPVAIEAGTIVYRNYDAAFVNELKKSENCRALRIDARIVETATGLSCLLADEDGCRSQVEIGAAKEKAQQPGMIATVIERQMRKSGGTFFTLGGIEVSVDPGLFFPVAVFNELRREAFAAHLRERLRSYRCQEIQLVVNSFPWPSTAITYKAAVANRKAEAFYRRHGVSDFSDLQDVLESGDAIALMTCKYCLKAQLALCPKLNPKAPVIREPLTLIDNTGEYPLRFDCENCGMVVMLPARKDRKENRK